MVRPCESTSTLPRPPISDRPIVEDPPPAFEPPDEAVAWSSPPPQPSTTRATSAIAAKASRRDRGFVRVMLVPLGWGDRPDLGASRDTGPGSIRRGPH